MRTKTIIVLALLVLPLGYWVAHANRAKSRAEAVCSAIEPNATFAAAEAIISEAGVSGRAHPTFLDEYVVRVPPDRIMVTFPSGITERWICGVQFAQGRMVKKDLALVD